MQDDSLKSYSFTAARLVAFIKRCQEHKMLHVIGQGFKDAMSCQNADEYYDRPSIKTLHALFISLFCPVDLTETTHDMSIHVCAFMRLASLNEHLVVHSPTRVMALTSRLEYLIRSAILIEVRSVGVYSVNPLPQDARMRDSLRFILSSQFNVLSRVVGVAKVAFSVGQATFTSVSRSSDGMHVCINNKTASLAAIQDMVHTLIKETKQLLSTMNIDYKALSGTHCRDEIAMLSIAASENHFDFARLGYNIFHGEHFTLKEDCILKNGRWFNRN